MPDETPPPTGPERAPPSFRPAPVLTVAVTGHRNVEATEARRIEEAATAVFVALAAEAARVAGRDAEFFDGSPPRLRVVSRFGEGADLAIMAAAERAGCELCAILPWGDPSENSKPPHPEVLAAGEPRRTHHGRACFEAGFQPAPQHEEGGSCCPARHLLAAAGTALDLGGEPGDERMRAAAGQALLDRADLLVAFWRGDANPSPGSTAALVQVAVRRRMPVLLLPLEAGTEATIIDDPDEHLLPAVATDLPRVALAENLDRVVARAFAAPADEAERQALRDCLAEPLAPRSHRPEYRLLLTIAARRKAEGPSLSSREEWEHAEAVAALVSPEAAAAVAHTEKLAARMEELAAFYGERARAGTVLRYGMPVVGGVFIALLAVMLPQYGLAWLGVQAVVMTLLVSESTWAVRRRWSERWLDYRSLAERLRCDRFLHPCGIGSRRVEDETGSGDPAWMRWCHRRLAAGTWAGGRISPAVVEAAMRHLVETEIPGQARYHEGAAVRYRSLGRRLGRMATYSAVGMLAASLVLLALPKSGTGLMVAVSLLMSVLIVLPSLFLASRGLRAEAGFELAAARSAQGAAALRRLAGRIEAAPPSYGRLVQASLGAARAMILDTVDWRVGLQRSRTPYRSEPAEPPGGGAAQAR